MLKIRNYSMEDYDVVRKIFERGIRDNFLPALKRNWNGKRPLTTLLHLTVLAMSLVVAHFISTWFGLLVGLVYLAAHIWYLDFFYNGYARQHLNTDLLDKEMKFWTTLPHFLLVATLDEQVVGMVSIQTKSEDTSELNRLSVDINRRGNGIGKALVEAAITRSKELGFPKVYLETSDVQMSASRLYERLGFKLIGQYVVDLGLPVFIPYIFHGIYIRQYLYESD